MNFFVEYHCGLIQQNAILCYKCCIVFYKSYFPALYSTKFGWASDVIQLVCTSFAQTESLSGSSLTTMRCKALTLCCHYGAFQVSTRSSINLVSDSEVNNCSKVAYFRCAVTPAYLRCQSVDAGRQQSPSAAAAADLHTEASPSSSQPWRGGGSACEKAAESVPSPDAGNKLGS